MLFVGTHGSDDPTKAAMPLISASGAIEGGHDVEVAFLGEAAYLALPGVADQVHAVAFGNVGERIRTLLGQGVRFYV